ncbi:dienelactone hydrolase family protein [Streptomyces roseifaciens]|uniref:dienelactone hydrolase family protein n=1 Tax=Streptomyces roseifaciens TaxID=1488406 RepID=UPI00071827C0|nr:dienelactone hydrolase family protein [Streptomyces roseifaciens]
MAELVDLSELSVRYGGAPGLHGHLARPPGEEPRPGVVVLFEAAGADAVNRRLNERMAEAGYLALMPDLYRGRSPYRCLVPAMRSLMSGRGPVYGDIEAARQRLLADPGCTGKVGVIGFCMGGGFALVLAGRGGYDAASANYGRPPDDLETAMRGACPVIASYGAKDRAFRGYADPLRNALERAGVPHDVEVYPDAGHSFFNHADNVPLLMRPVMRAVMGIGPEPASAADAWRRIEAFFAEHLAAD